MSLPSPQRVLFVSYLFPPTGGVGVHRVSKFVKYLPKFGWDSSVLTVSNASVPLIDESLLKDIPNGTIIRRAKTYEPSYAMKAAVSGGQTARSFSGRVKAWIKGKIRNTANLALQPDTQILWHHHAYKAGLKLLNEVPHAAIIATGPPFSSLILGERLSRKTGLPLILDYRDEWDISNAYWENKKQGRIANWVQTRQQRKVVQAADLILATTPSSANAIGEFARSCNARAATDFIYNGFDPDDFDQQSGTDQARLHDPDAKFRLAFIGTLWNLNSIEPVVSALLKICKDTPILAERIELFLAGRRTPDQEAILERLQGSPIDVIRKPFVSHDEAIQLMRSADALLMLNSNLPKAHRIINAKTFEYMAARRPMFVVAPQGDVWDLVQDLPGTTLCPPDDINMIAERLSLALELHRCGERYLDATWNISAFERHSLAGQLAGLLERVVNIQSTTNSGRSSAMTSLEGPGGQPCI